MYRCNSYKLCTYTITLNSCFVLQSLALAGPCFIQTGIGIEFTCSTIIIGALASDKSNDVLPPLTDEQASWFGKITYLNTKLIGLTNPIS